MLRPTRVSCCLTPMWSSARSAWAGGAWETDVIIPRNYGIYQPVGDSVMPGGILRAMRMIPALVEIARDVKALCPQALFINYSNPMTANCWAIREATGVPVVGLCHGVFHVQQQLARLIGAPPEQVTALAVGLNHLTWFTDLRWHDRDAWPLIRAPGRRARRVSRLRFDRQHLSTNHTVQQQSV